MQPISPPNKLRQAATMLSGSFFFTTGLLAYMVFQSASAVVQKTTVENALRDHPFVIPVAVIAILTVIASFFVGKVLFRGGELLPDHVKRQKRFTAFIISMAMAEATGIYGFVIGLNTKSFELALPFFAVSFAVMAFHWLKIQDIK